MRNGAGDTIKMELMDILKGEYINPHVSIWWYKLDSIDEVGNPDMWLKANPNIGKTVSYETYQLDVERAEKSPAARNDILAKRFGLPMEGYTYYFTYEETLPHKKRSYWQMPCSLGINYYFSMLFKRETGEGFAKYLTRVRIEEAKTLLRETSIPIAEICEKVGYSDRKHFTHTFHKATGLNPVEYRKLYG